MLIRYSHNGGLTYIEQLPKNVGNYPVQLIAKIQTADATPKDVEYNEKVSFIIKSKEVELTLKDYSSSNPITKEYDKLKSISSPETKIVPYISLSGICDEDKNNIKIDVSKIRAEFSGSVVNDISSLYNLNINEIYLIDIITNQQASNYTIASGTSKVFERVGKINPLELEIKGVVVYDKVNDGSTDVSANIDNLVLAGKLEHDSTEIIKENLKFYHDEIDENYKGTIDVHINFDDAISGADSVNYTFVYDPITINIHPYELEVYVNGVGTFKIVDYDKKCLIPLDCKLIAKAHTKGSSEYNKILNLTENRILKSENLQSGYEVVIQVNGINQVIPEGLYICLPNVNKVTKVFQKIDNETTESVDYVVKDGFIVVKAQKGKAVFGVVVKTTYLPLWLIILIVGASIAAVGLIVVIFIVVRRKSKRKYQRFDRI